MHNCTENLEIVRLFLIALNILISIANGATILTPGVCLKVLMCTKCVLGALRGKENMDGNE